MEDQTPEVAGGGALWGARKNMRKLAATQIWVKGRHEGEPYPPHKAPSLSNWQDRRSRPVDEALANVEGGAQWGARRSWWKSVAIQILVRGQYE